MSTSSGSSSVLLPAATKEAPIFNFNAPPVEFRSLARAVSNSDGSESESPDARPSRTNTRSARLNITRPIRAMPAMENTTQIFTANQNIPQPGQHEMEDDADARELATHLALLKTAIGQQDHHEVAGTPIFTMPVLKHSKHLFSQYGFIAGLSDVLDSGSMDEGVSGTSTDPRLFFNISAPSSAFICGSQGSGKSHTLSCLLENCLTKSHVSKLDNPLAGLVFHYDPFTSDLKGAPCEAAHLASNFNIKVRVLCSPANLETIRRTYLGMNVQIEPLRINQSDLNTKRMLDLMAFSPDDGPMPLYLHAINRILRDMRMIQQQTNGTFNYAEFKRLVADTNMTPGQLAPLTQRLDTLESFMPKSQTEPDSKEKPTKKQKEVDGNDWTIKPGTLTIVDLSCPCVTPEGACALFNMCLSLFLEQKTSVGRVVALDEAHKYMNNGSEASALTNTLLSSIRLQRHLGTRVFISTQEPTISPKLLDLCSLTIVHRFSSPDWLRCLKLHLAALDTDEEPGQSQKGKMINIFNQIVKLRIGEALLFAPSAIIGVDTVSDEPSRGDKIEIKRLGLGYLKIKVRARITTDGGKSVLATGSGKIPMNLKSGGAPKSGSTASLGTTPTTSTPSVLKPKPDLAAPPTSLFGAPSPTTGIFAGITANAPSLPKVESLKTRGTLGLNHTPPVTRTASGPFDVKRPEIGKLVHGTSNSSIFGSLSNNKVSSAKTENTSTSFDVGKASGSNWLLGNSSFNTSRANSLTLQENKKPTSTAYPQAESISNTSLVNIANTNNNLSSSLFATPKKSPFANNNTSPAAPALTCPGTRSALFIPYIETEASISTPGVAQQNIFQNVSAQDVFAKFSQEELRLADYALVGTLRGRDRKSLFFGGL